MRVYFPLAFTLYTLEYTVILSVQDQGAAPLYKGSNIDSLNLSNNTYTVFITLLHLFDRTLEKFQVVRTRLSD
jgi:hypothetical protein